MLIVTSAGEVAAIMPPRRRGRKMHRSAFHRWCARGQDGVVLASIWIGGERFTTVEALQSVLLRESDVGGLRLPADGTPVAASDHPGRLAAAASGASRRHRSVEAELERYGL